MSIERGDRIILMMFRSICCWNRTKVADSSEIVAKEVLKNVFLVVTENVYERQLIGPLITAITDRHLMPVQMKQLHPTQEMIDKSNLVKNERRGHYEKPWMLLMFRGREAQTRVADCINQFKNTHSLHKRDIYFTENEQQAKHEEEIWFKDEEVVSSSANGEFPEAAEGNGVIADAESVKEDGDVASEVNSEISNEGPHPSVPSSRINSETELNPIVHSVLVPVTVPILVNEDKKDEEGPTAEVISNTADILEPEDPVPVPTPVQRPPSAHVAVAQNPTKIE